MDKLFLFVIAVVAISIALVTYLQLQKDLETKITETGYTPLPSPNKYFDEQPKATEKTELFKPPEGRQHFQIINNGGYPKITEAEIDPLDVKVGDIQKMIVVAEDPDGIRSVIAYIETDNRINEIPLNYSEGNWSGSWVVYDTHSINYTTVFVARNTKGESINVTLAWSDYCSPPAGGDWTLDSSCAFASGVNGVDNGNLIINNGAYTLTIGGSGSATFAWNSGKEIQLSAGTIAISTQGQLLQTNLWMFDADTDNYPKNTTQWAQDEAPGFIDYVRRYTLSSITSTDCMDTNSGVNPGITAYFTTDRGDGSYDYDCSGSAEKDPAKNCCATETSCMISGTAYAGYFCSQIGSPPACGVGNTWLNIVHTTDCFGLGGTGSSSCTSGQSCSSGDRCMSSNVGSITMGCH